MANLWNELDLAAEQNLSNDKYSSFLAYKAELKAELYTWSEAERILVGFIWDESENL